MRNLWLTLSFGVLAWDCTEFVLWVGYSRICSSFKGCGLSPIPEVVDAALELVWTEEGGVDSAVWASIWRPSSKLEQGKVSLKCSFSMVPLCTYNHEQYSRKLIKKAHFISMYPKRINRTGQLSKIGWEIFTDLALWFEFACSRSICETLSTVLGLIGYSLSRNSWRWSTAGLDTWSPAPCLAVMSLCRQARVSFTVDPCPDSSDESWSFT